MWDYCRCAACGRSPARPATFISIFSLLIAVQSSRVSGDFCRDCAVVAYEGRTKALLGLAWWGVGIFAAPVFTVINWIALVKCRSLAAPVERAADDADGQIATGNATVNAAGNTTRYAAISPNPFLYAAPVALWLPLAYVLSLLSP